MTDQNDDAPSRAYVPVTTSVALTNDEAALLRDLAAVAGRPLESLVADFVAGRIVLPPSERPTIDWALFDGPGDLYTCRRAL